MHGNVEHFSICSNDSIWHEREAASACEPTNKKYDLNSFYHYEANYHKNATDQCYVGNSQNNNNNNNNNEYNDEDDTEPQCFFVSSTTTENEPDSNPFSQHVNKYKNHIMEKYLRDCQKPENQLQEEITNKDDSGKPSMISKWLESAANFRPSQNNYLNWTLAKAHKKKCKKPSRTERINYQQHGREELDAAEALTRLANAYNSKIQEKANK